MIYDIFFCNFVDWYTSKTTKSAQYFPIWAGLYTFLGFEVYV